MTGSSAEILNRIAEARGARSAAERALGALSEKSADPKLGIEAREPHKKEARKTWLYMNYFDRVIAALHDELMVALSREALPRGHYCNKPGHIVLRGETRCFRCGKEPKDETESRRETDGK